MSRKLRVAIIGGGQVAETVHASYYLTRNDLELVAVVDSQAERAAEFAARLGIPQGCNDA